MIHTARRFAVVGGGVSGLATARSLVKIGAARGRSVEVSLFESADRVGGRVFTDSFQGAAVDLGAESLLARSEDTWTLLSELGIAAEAVTPATTSAAIWTGQRMVPIPKGSAMGVPTRPLRLDVVRAIGIRGALRASLEPWLGHRRPDEDSAVGPFVRDRVGSAVFNQLVDPLLGGVYAGTAAQLSLGAVAPQLLRALEHDSSLLRGLRRQQAAAGPPGRAAEPSRPTFISFRGGLGRLVQAMEASLPVGTVQKGMRVTGISRTVGSGAQLTFATQDAREFQGVVLAVPAPQAAELLRDLSPELQAELGTQEWASVATVTLAYHEGAFPRPPSGSGFLVSRSARRVVTACTFMDRKWPHLKQPGQVLLRVSVGSAGEEAILSLDDTTVISSVHNSLRRALSLSSLPQQARVQRWQPALPQYRAGQLAWRGRVDSMAAALPIPVVLTGAAYGGVGIAACLREGAAAAQRVWEPDDGSRPSGASTSAPS